MPIQPDDDLTIGAVPATMSRGGPPISPRFVPGAIVGGRYRLVALLGRGGMGEVYRADDLTLDHPVALKFLPDGVAHDGARLAQFHNELRIARQVSHKNVCRLYDLGETDGRQFLTMEYVDGEDLASLLRRIGRLPPDKAIEIARQLCAGLAAAHERGVLHRDLKPANVMLDGDGNVRIADFGLAIADGAGETALAGTPQYMAPEQLAGQPASVKSDIYALGLVLFEIFTGSRAYEAKTLQQLQQMQQSGPVTTPSSVVRDLDPAVERVILRCLERDPAQRPASAIGVAAALPGGDPIAAALAAGETPSPEMVAAAGATSALHPAIGVSLVAFVVIGLLTAAVLSDRQSLVARVPLDKSIDALDDRARELAGKLGYPDRPADSLHGIGSNGEYLSWVARTDLRPSRWDPLAAGYIPGLKFWYRSSPRDLVPLSAFAIPTLNDPPLTVTGMVSIVLDPRGGLADFVAVPPQVETTSAPAANTNWTPLFDAAALPMSEFRRVDSQWTPRVYADERAAWEGTVPGQPQTPLRVEAAAYRGKLVSFQTIGPWTIPSRMRQQTRTETQRLLTIAAASTILLLIAGAAALARHNLRVGRGDRRGAARLALFVLAVSMLAWAVGARHVADPSLELNQLLVNLALGLLTACLLWLMYIALEPYVRRYCPDIMISWTRLLGGQLRDPLVGRDVLFGAAVGILVVLMSLAFQQLVPALLGKPPAFPRVGNLQYLLGARFAASALLRTIPNAMTNALCVALVFVMGRALSGRTWVGATAAVVLFVLLVLNEFSESPLVGVVFALLYTGMLVATLVYFGLLALVVAFFVYFAVNNGITTIDLSKMYAATGVWLMVAMAGLAAFGFYTSRAGQPLFGNLLKD